MITKTITKTTMKLVMMNALIVDSASIADDTALASFPSRRDVGDMARIPSAMLNIIGASGSTIMKTIMKVAKKASIPATGARITPNRVRGATRMMIAIATKTSASTGLRHRVVLTS